MGRLRLITSTKQAIEPTLNYNFVISGPICRRTRCRCTRCPCSGGQFVLHTSQWMEAKFNATRATIISACSCELLRMWGVRCLRLVIWNYTDTFRVDNFTRHTSWTIDRVFLIVTLDNFVEYSEILQWNSLPKSNLIGCDSCTILK